MTASPQSAPWPEGKAPASGEELLDCLNRSRVLPAEEGMSFLESLPSTKRPFSAKVAATELLKAGKITRFQAQCALAGKVKYLAFGEYVVLEKLGQGGMGQVLKAEHRRMKRLVALKIMAPAAMKNADAVKRFQREVHAAARLIHPNIVTAFDANEHQGIHFFVMEYVEGQDLGALVAERGALPPRQAAEYVVQAAKGLAYAHGKGIVHRDIKPGNLLLDAEGTVKILDMGLARIDLATEERSELTNTGQVMGTIDYMAPEQAEDTHTADARADIYSLGCTLYRLITGEPLFGGDTVVKKLLAHRTTPPPSLASGQRKLAGNDALLTRLDPIFQKMVAKRPEDRQQSMAEVVKVLEACLRGDNPSASPSAAIEPTIDLKLSEFLSGISAQAKPSTSVAEKAAKKAARKPPTLEVTQDLSAADTTVGWDKAAAAPVPPATKVSGEKSKIEPRMRQRLLFPRYISSRPLAALAAGCLALGLAAAGVVIFLQTGDSTVRVEINDPSIEVTVSQTGYKIKGKTEEIRVQPGEHTLHVQAGDLEFDTSKFVLGKGDNPAVKVELLAGKVRVAQSDGKVLGEKSRRVADSATSPRRWMLELDGAAGPRVSELPLPVAGPLTIEAWINPGVGTDGGHLIAFLPVLAVTYSSDGKWYVQTKTNSGYERSEYVNHPARGGLTHVAGVLEGTEMRLYVAGKLATRKTISSLPAAAGRVPEVFIGFGPDNNGLPGTYAEIRLSKAARYQGDFVPRPRFEPDEQTVALFHCDEGSGNKLRDAISGRQVALAAGARWVQQALPTAKTSIDRDPEAAKWAPGVTADSSTSAKPGATAGLSSSAFPAVPQASKSFTLSFDGQDDIVRVESLKHEGTQPLTVECWAQPRSFDRVNTVFAVSGRLFLQACKLPGREHPTWQWVAARPERLTFQTLEGPPLTSVPDRPVHLAGIFDGRRLRFFIDGRRQSDPPIIVNAAASTATPTSDEFTLAIPVELTTAAIGGQWNGAAQKPFFMFDGTIDELRVSNVARYDKDFSPAQRLAPDEHTLALYHFNEDDGDKLTDYSGNRHHGQIVGATWTRP